MGGAEVVKNLGESGFETKDVAPMRRRNMARAFGWLIAKDSLTIGVLKPLDFTALKAQTRDFLQDLFKQIYIDTQLSAPLLARKATRVPELQNRERDPVERVFMKASKYRDLAVGLAHILRQLFKREDGDGEQKEFVEWANNIALETLRSSVDIV